jgi:hypothetical protein
MLYAPLPHPLVARPTGQVAMPAPSSHSAGSPPTPHRRRTGVAPASHRRHVVRTDRLTPLADAPYNGSDPTSTHSPHGGPLEAAQRVWHHSLELADHCDQLDPSDQALALLRTARHDADTMTHALGLGRSQARHPSNDETTRRGVRLLERAIAFLGVEAQPGQIARPGPR